MSLNSIKVGTVFIVASMIVTGGCSKSSDGLTADQKHELDSLSQLKTQAHQNVSDADQEKQDYNKKLADLSQEIQDVSEREAAAKKLGEEQAETQTKILALQQELNDQKASQARTAQEQQDMQKNLAYALQKNTQEEARIRANELELNQKSAAIEANVNALKTQFRTPDEAKQAMYDSFVSGGSFPMIAIVTGDDMNKHNAILSKIRTFDPKVRYGHYEVQNQGTSRFVFMASNASDLSTLDDLVTKKMGLHLSISPFYRLIVRSYANLYYSKSMFSRSGAHDDFFIGQSQPVTVGLNYPNMSIDNVFSYTTLPSSCKVVTPGCITDLRASGYIDGADKKIEGSGETASSFLKRKLDRSLSLLKENGDSRALLPRNEVIVDISLTHKIFAEVDQGGKSGTKEYLQMPYGTPENYTASIFTSDPFKFGDFLENVTMALNKPLPFQAPTVVDGGPQTVEVQAPPLPSLNLNPADVSDEVE